MIGPHGSLSRRRFLAHSGLAAMAGVLAGCGSAVPSVPPSLASVAFPLAPVQRGPVGSMEALHAIGHAWFAAHPDDGDPDDLATALGIASTVDVRGQLAGFAGRIQEDFGAGRIVALDGWRLAETEVRLATLVWLLEGAPPPA